MSLFWIHNWIDSNYCINMYSMCPFELLVFSLFQGPSGADGIAGNKGLMVGPASNNLSVQLMMLQLSNVGSSPQATEFRIQTHHFSLTRQPNIKCRGLYWWTSKRTITKHHQDAQMCSQNASSRYQVRVYVIMYVNVLNPFTIYKCNRYVDTSTGELFISKSWAFLASTAGRFGPI